MAMTKIMMGNTTRTKAIPTMASVVNPSETEIICKDMTSTKNNRMNALNLLRVR